MPDIVAKLDANPDRLEILSDGRQAKSYAHVSESVDTMVTIRERETDPFSVTNVETGDTVTIDEIASIVSGGMGCAQVLVSPG